MIELKENNNGNFTGYSSQGTQLTIYQTKDEYGTPENQWRWLMSHKAAQWSSDDKFDTPEVATADLTFFIDDFYGKEVEMELVR